MGISNFIDWLCTSTIYFVGILLLGPLEQVQRKKRERLNKPENPPALSGIIKLRKEIETVHGH